MIPNHRLLQRQMRKYLGASVDPELQQFLRAVDEAYAQMDADRALIERTLELSSAELSLVNQTLRQRLTQIEAMQQQLVAQEKLASLGGLTAGIAHEIKNPLNFINNFAELSIELLDELLEQLQSDDPGAIDEARDLAATLQSNLATVLRHGKRADGIVRGMLQHARGHAEPHHPLDFNAVVQEYAELAFHGHRARAPQTQVELTCQLDPSVQQVSGSTQDLGRVLLNLVGNACEAAGQPGEPGKVHVQTSDLGHAVRLQIANSGAGIAADIAERIFEPFFTTKPPGEGTGLGLSISHDIVRSHGGSLRLTNRQPVEMTIDIPYLSQRTP